MIIRVGRYLGFFIGCLFSACAVANVISIGTNPQGTLAYASGAAIASVASNVTGKNFRVVPQGGPPVTIPMLNAGNINFSIADLIATDTSYRGNNQIFQKANKNIRVVSVLYPIYLSIAVLKNSDIKDLKDLKGQKVAASFVNQKNIRPVLNLYLNEAGLKKDQVKLVPVQSTAEAAKDLGSGRVDAAIAAVGSSVIEQAGADTHGIRYLSLPNTEQSKKIIQKYIPGGSSSLLTKKSNYTEIKNPTRVLTEDFVLLTNKNTPENLVYNLTKAIYMHHKTLEESVAPFKRSQNNGMYKKLPVKYAKGALKFYKQHKLINDK